MAKISRAVYLSLAVIAGFGSFPAHAGFEWMPPAQVEVSAPQQVQQAPAPSMPASDGMSAFPAPEVMSAPTPLVQEAMAPVPVVEQQPIDNYVDAAPQKTIAPEMMPRMTANNPAELIINPYPLQNGFTEQAPEMQLASIDQAMMAQSNLLNPMPISRTETTAAQPRPAPVPGAVALGGNAAPHQMASMTPQQAAGGMTPLPGGEPAPLAIPGVTTTGQTSYSEAIGFGRDLPLAMALSQVVPEGFAYSFGENVDPGANVSWEGGRPWNEVLQEMLAPSGLSAHIDQNRVIVHAGSSAT